MSAIMERVYPRKPNGSIAYTLGLSYQRVNTLPGPKVI